MRAALAWSVAACMVCVAAAAPQQPSAAALAPPKEAGKALCVEQEQQLLQQSPVNALEVGQGWPVQIRPVEVSLTTVAAAAAAAAATLISFPCLSQALSDGQRAFSVSLLRHLAATSEGNLFVSPHSIYQALLLAYFTAAGHTEEAVKRVLQLPEGLAKVPVMHAYKFEEKMLQIRAQNSTSYELRTANRLFIDKSQPVRECLGGVLKVRPG